MSYVDSIKQLHSQCPLCDHPYRESPHHDIDRDLYWVVCEVCGRYGITDDVFRFTPLTTDAKSLLSAVVRRHFDFTGKQETITSESWEALVSQAPDKNDVTSKVRYLLEYIAHKSIFPGERIVLKGQTDYPICFAGNADEFEFYVQYATEAGFVQCATEAGILTGRPGCWLTTGGWEETRRIPTLESPYAFVAMSFSKEGSHGSVLARAFQDAIQPAIEDDAGYQAVRIDKEQFLGDIVFEIIARIKECRFVVADATGHKNGVYFEAGYAMGMGLPVIWMCHKDDLDDAHFDTSHLNHIVWDDIGELRRNLANRILATIGRGPRKRQE